MAKARAAAVLPRLVFRDSGVAKAEGKRKGTFRQSNVELGYVHVNRAQAFKTVFLGNSNVGKTCLAKLIVDRQVVEQTTNTIGFDHHTKEMKLEEGIPVSLQIWDTAGMEQFRNALVTKYYRNADGIVLVFDISKRESFEGLDSWISEVKQYCEHGTEKLKMVLIGNKVDRHHQRKVTTEEAQAYADRHNMISYVELSAKDIKYLPVLDDTLVILARQMLRIREELEVTQSAAFADEIIRLKSTSEEWEILSAPSEPVPDYVYKAQEKRIETPKCRC